MPNTKFNTKHKYMVDSILHLSVVRKPIIISSKWTQWGFVGEFNTRRISWVRTVIFSLTHITWINHRWRCADSIYMGEYSECWRTLPIVTSEVNKLKMTVRDFIWGHNRNNLPCATNKMILQLVLVLTSRWQLIGIIVLCLPGVGWCH